LRKSKSTVKKLSFRSSKKLPFPNPFTTSTSIEIFIAKKSHAVIRIFNTLGVKTDEINLGTLEGNYRVEYAHPHLTGGLYYYTLEVNGEKAGAKKMIAQ